MLSLTGAGSAGSAAVLANDTFTDVVNTDLVSHTMSPVGQGWQENAAGGYLINNSNQAAAQGVAGYVSAQTQTNHSSVTVTADINFSGNTGNDLGLQLRYVDDSNFWALLIDMANGNFELLETVAGVDTVRATTTFNPAPSTTYGLKAVCSGDVISGFIDGGNSISYNSASDFDN